MFKLRTIRRIQHRSEDSHTQLLERRRGSPHTHTHSNFEATSKHDAEYLQFIHLNKTDPSNISNFR